MKQMYSLEIPVSSFLAKCPSTQVSDEYFCLFIIMTSFLVRIAPTQTQWAVTAESKAKAQVGYCKTNRTVESPPF